MEHLNLYTFKHSALPPLDNAMKGEIAEIDFNVSNLILKLQGHYRALSELHETLSNLLDSCDLNLKCIRIVPDGNDDKAAPRAIGLTDLSVLEKQVVISTAITSTVAIEMLSGIFSCDFERAADQVRTTSQQRFGQMTSEEIDQAIDQLANVVLNDPDGGGFFIEV